MSFDLAVTLHHGSCNLDFILQEHGHRDDVFNVELLEAESKVANTASHVDSVPHQTSLTGSAGYGTIHNGDGSDG